ncbi:sporulation protein [Psychromonas sp. psych-6C06]|uniref:SPOR domain-containing protein n=1 Tax=Psychromonas sp. psych-6C06 TaxID=2058089 RepID=UPI000C3277A2|nr:SPOR domain-containing protein [Psychromonas sp. psych-6C06]PKF63846.1 sporulation protein [Psychromonas sp. psych-6C06]
MASQFQNRLVGISILVACVVIFLPSIIDGKKMAYEDEFVATPINPEFKAHTQQLDTNSSTSPLSEQKEPKTANVENDTIADDEWQVEEMTTPVTIEAPKESIIAEVKTEIKTASNTQPVAKPTQKPMLKAAWTIQLGAFQNAANINSLLKTLHKAGFQAHTVPRDVIDGELTRLFVGPDVSKEKLQKQLPRLKRLTQLEGKLLPFDAVNP